MKTLLFDTWCADYVEFLASCAIDAHHDRIQRAYNRVTAEPTITQLEGDCIRVCLDGSCGFVSSFHLVEPKLNQLRAANDNTSASRQKSPHHTSQTRC